MVAVISHTRTPVLPEAGSQDLATAMLLLRHGFWKVSSKAEDRPSVGRNWLKRHPNGENSHTYA